MNPTQLEDGFRAMPKNSNHDQFLSEVRSAFGLQDKQRPLTIEQIAELFDCKLSTLDTNANIFKLIDAVRKVEKAHGIN